MFSLVLNILGHIVNHRLPDRKRAVSILPIEIHELRSLFFHPFRRSPLQFHDNIREGFGSVEIEENVNMVPNRIHDERGAIQVAQDAARIIV